MPKVTIYTKDRDDETWEWARHHADEDGLSLSYIVGRALREYRERVEARITESAAER